MAKLILLLALLPCLTLAFNNCGNVKFSGPRDCAILFDDDDCEQDRDDWKEVIPVGYNELAWNRRNDAGAVVVKAGCTFVGYQFANRGGRIVTVDAKGQTGNVVRSLDDSREEDDISAVECTC